MNDFTKSLGIIVMPVVSAVLILIAYFASLPTQTGNDPMKVVSKIYPSFSEALVASGEVYSEEPMNYVFVSYSDNNQTSNYVEFKANETYSDELLNDLKSVSNSELGLFFTSADRDYIKSQEMILGRIMTVTEIDAYLNNK